MMCCYFWYKYIYILYLFFFDTYTYSDLTAQIYQTMCITKPKPNQSCNPSTPLQSILRNDFQTPRVVETKGLMVRTLLVRSEAGCRFQTAFVWFLQRCDLTCQMCWMEDLIYQFGEARKWSPIAGLSVLATNIWWLFIIHEFLNVTMNSILHQKNHPTQNYNRSMKLHQHVRSIYLIYKIYIHRLFLPSWNSQVFFKTAPPKTEPTKQATPSWQRSVPDRRSQQWEKPRGK